MRYGVLIKDVTEEDGFKYEIVNTVGRKSGELFSFTRAPYTFQNGMVGFVGTSIGALPMEFAVEISESEYNRITKPKTPEYTMAELTEKLGHEFKLIKE